MKNKLFFFAYILFICSRGFANEIREPRSCKDSVVIKVCFDSSVNEIDHALYYLSERDSFGNKIKISSFEFLNAVNISLPIRDNRVMQINKNGRFSEVVGFIASPGDSIVLNILADTAYATNRNREIIALRAFHKKLDSISQNFIERSEFYLNTVLNKQYNALGGYYLMKKAGVGAGAYLKYRDSLMYALQDQLQFEIHAIDSFQSAKLISPQFAAFSKNQRKHNKAWIMLNLSRRYEDSARITDMSGFGYYHDSLVFEPTRGYTSLLVSDFLLGYILKNRKAQLTKDWQGVDYTQAYEFCENKVSGLNRSYIRYYCLVNIKQDYSNEVFTKFYNRFLKEETYMPLVNYVRENLSPPPPKSDKTTDLLFTNRNKTVDFLKIKNRGRLLYVDFWASWCAPCRKAMSASKALKNEFENQPITFVYISIDKNKPQWIDASIMENLNHYENSYLLADPSSAGLISKYKIDAIPRYMLFDKNGDIISANAPPPDSEAIRELIRESLIK